MFAIGILPYITASIIVQMLTQVIPRLERLRKEGPGRARRRSPSTPGTSRWGSASLYAVVTCRRPGRARLFPGSGCWPAFHPLIPHPTRLTIATMVITMVSGTAVIMWMGELITDRGVGNGMSVLMFTSIMAVIPARSSRSTTKGFLYAAAAILVIIAVTTFIVFIEQGQRRIPVQYAKRITGRRVYGGGSTFIPVKVNQAGVVPVIFASSLL